MIPGWQHFPEGQIIAFALVFLRCVAFIVAWPIFGTQLVPVHVKVALALVFSMVLFPTVHFQNSDFINMGDELIFISIREIIMGLFLGFLLKFFFFAVSISGELIGVSSGLASAQLFNPAMGSQTSVMEQANLILATLFLLAMNGHHLFIQGLAQSFDLVPISSVGFNYKGFSSLALSTQEFFLMGIRMASPVLVAVFITNLTMGLLGRAVPQLNVMMTSFQVTICVSITVFFISMPLFVGEMDGLLQMMAERFFSTLKVI